MGARERMMRKVRDYDAELKALGDKARTLKATTIDCVASRETLTTFFRRWPFLPHLRLARNKDRQRAVEKVGVMRINETNKIS
jgi:hypothetical protein